MPITIIRDEVFTGHEPGPGHPECPERLASIDRALESTTLTLVEQTAREATADEVARVHTDAHVERILGLRGRTSAIDADTRTSKGSVEAALRAVGASIDLATSIAKGEAEPGIALVRPPGHHATARNAMGFCLLNNVAAAAAALVADGLAERVLIYDFDVHHGNGTQDIFYEDRNIMYLSTHQYPFYPGTGADDEIGRGRGKGTTVNIPFPAGVGDDLLDTAHEKALLPIARKFEPDFILLSAGFDGFQNDPLGGLKFTENGFRQVAKHWRRLAEEVTDGKIAAVLEGGYDLQGLGGCVHGFLEEWA